MKKIELLLVSTLCSNSKYNEVRANRTKQSLDPARRLFDALVTGLVNENVNVTCISALPFSKNNTNLHEIKREEERYGAKYIYLGFRISTINRLHDLYVNTKKEVQNWINQTEGKRRFVICDSLVLMCSLPARKLAQKNGIPVVAFVTDYPSLATSIKGKSGYVKSFLSNIFDKTADNDLKKYDGYILVAKGLSELIGKKCDNFEIIEDIVSIPDETNVCKRREDNKKIIVYGGALCERFGINKLVDAIQLIKDEKLELHLYGSGESEQYILDAQKKDKRVYYGGTVSFEDMIKIEKNSDLLINPRPSDETFSKYSFPSKTLSYILSGTPVLSTRIPGIPKEYEDLLFWFDDESTESIAEKIIEILNLSPKILREKGAQAYAYVCENKNANAQAKKVIKYLSQIKGKYNGK